MTHTLLIKIVIKNLVLARIRTACIFIYIYIYCLLSIYTLFYLKLINFKLFDQMNVVSFVFVIKCRVRDRQNDNCLKLLLSR